MIRGWCRHWFPRETEDRVQDVYCKLVDRLKTFEYDPARGTVPRLAQDPHQPADGRPEEVDAARRAG